LRNHDAGKAQNLNVFISHDLPFKGAAGKEIFHRELKIHGVPR